MYTYSVTTQNMGISFVETDDWQTALNTWSEMSFSSPSTEIQINVLKEIEGELIKVRSLLDITSIGNHSDYLLFLEHSKENRVTKRLVAQEYDGMEVVEQEQQESYEDFMGRMYRETALDAKNFVDESESLEGILNAAMESLNRQGDVDFHGDFEDMDDAARDAIINPKHYKTIPAGNYPNGLEYMDICEHALSHLDGVKSHLVGQILKYTLRVGKKDAFLQDARKIEWYAKRLVETVEREE